MCFVVNLFNDDHLDGLPCSWKAHLENRDFGKFGYIDVGSDVGDKMC